MTSEEKSEDSILEGQSDSGFFPPAISGFFLPAKSETSLFEIF